MLLSEFMKDGFGLLQILLHILILMPCAKIYPAVAEPNNLNVMDQKKIVFKDPQYGDRRSESVHQDYVPNTTE